MLLSAAAFAVGPTAARFAFDAGSNTLTVVALRSLIGLVLMAGLVLAMGQSFRIDRRSVPACIGAGLAYTAMSYGFIGAVATIPVSAAVLIFFTHPLLIALIWHVRGKDRLTPRKAWLALSVPVGLALALGGQLAALDTTGVLLAALAAVAMCGLILFTTAAQLRATTTQVNLYATLLMAAILTLVATATDSWVPPTGWQGWLGLTGAGAGIAVGILAFFAAFRFIGPVRATMLSNCEPLLGVVLAAALLGERLESTQWVGVGIVVVALVLFEAPAARPARQGAQ